MPAGLPFLSLKLYGSYSSLPIIITGRASDDTALLSEQPLNMKAELKTAAAVHFMNFFASALKSNLFITEKRSANRPPNPSCFIEYAYDNLLSTVIL